MVEVSKDEFEFFIKWYKNFAKDSNGSASPLSGRAVYRSGLEVLGIHYFEYKDSYELSESVYNKIINSDYRNNLEESMSFCLNCNSLVPKEVLYCSNKCKYNYEM